MDIPASLNKYKFYEDNHASVLLGDAREVLEAMSEASVDMCLCSPPYYGLRAYKCEPVIWDGDENCKHEWGGTLEFGDIRFRGEGSIVGNNKNPDIWQLGNGKSSFCLRCHAWRGVLGMEPTPQLYIQHLCGIFDQVRRVLKPTGTMFINISDSYNGSGHKEVQFNSPKQMTNHGATSQGGTSLEDIPSKSLIGIPARFQIEMINRGWICRNDIIWWKRSCMPESVSDRFTRDFEHIFFFSNQGKYYFEQQFDTANYDGRHDTMMKPSEKYANRNIMAGESANTCHSDGAERWPNEIDGVRQRNKRTVWDITSGGGSKFEHYASYPVKLCETPIKAGCPEYICPKCGKARERMYNSTPAQSKECPKTQEAHEARGGIGIPVGTIGKSGSGRIEGETSFIGYSSCACTPSTSLEQCVPGVVLDPFAGTGTTGYAAKQLGRKSILIDVSPEYCAMSVKRLKSLPGVQKGMALDIPEAKSFRGRTKPAVSPFGPEVDFCGSYIYPDK